MGSNQYRKLALMEKFCKAIERPEVLAEVEKILTEEEIEEVLHHIRFRNDALNGAW